MFASQGLVLVHRLRSFAVETDGPGYGQSPLERKRGRGVGGF